MKLKEWLMAQKKKRLVRKQQRAIEKYGEAAVELQMLDDGASVQRSEGESGTEYPKSRFTEEYKQFLKAQEEAQSNTQNRIEES